MLVTPRLGGALLEDLGRLLLDVEGNNLALRANPGGDGNRQASHASTNVEHPHARCEIGVLQFGGGSRIRYGVRTTIGAPGLAASSMASFRSVSGWLLMVMGSEVELPTGGELQEPARRASVDVTGEPD